MWVAQAQLQLRKESEDFHLAGLKEVVGPSLRTLIQFVALECRLGLRLYKKLQHELNVCYLFALFTIMQIKCIIIKW